MFCPKCGSELEEGNNVCPKCGFDITTVDPNIKGKNENVSDKSSDLNSNNNILESKKKKSHTVRGIIYLIIAAYVLISFYSAATEIESAGYNMALIRSVSGNSVAESYYQEVGSAIIGFSSLIRVIGVFCSALLAAFGFKSFENN